MPPSPLYVYVWVKPGKVERIPGESNRKGSKKVESGAEGKWEGGEKGKDLEEGNHHQELVVRETGRRTHKNTV